jgi:hypothetical protein
MGILDYNIWAHSYEHIVYNNPHVVISNYHATTMDVSKPT